LNLLNTIAAALRNQKQGLLPSAAGVFAIKVSAAVVAFFVNVILARILGPEDIGIYFLALTVVNMVFVIGMVGMNNALIRFAARSCEKKDWPGLSGLYRSSGMIVLSVTTAVMILTLIFAPWIADAVFSKPELGWPLRLMALAVLPMNILTLHVNMLKGMQRFRSSTVMESLAIPVIMVVLLLLFRKVLGLSEIVLCYISAITLVCCGSFLIWHRAYPKPEGSKGSFDRGLLMQTSLPLFGVAILNLFMNMTDTVMLGIWKDSQVIGIYGVALRLTAISSMFLLVINTIVAPRFSILFDRGDHKELSKLARESTLLMALIAAMFLALFISVPSFILSLFGQGFTAGVRVLIILALGQFVVLATGPVAALLMMTGYEKFHRNTTALSAALNVVLNFTLIPRYGGEGAAFATAVSLSVKNVLAVLHVRKRLNIPLFFAGSSH